MPVLFLPVFLSSALSLRSCLSDLIHVFIHSTVNGKGVERWSEKDSSYLSSFDNGNYLKVI